MDINNVPPVARSSAKMKRTMEDKAAMTAMNDGIVAKRVVVIRVVAVGCVWLSGVSVKMGMGEVGTLRENVFIMRGAGLKHRVKRWQTSCNRLGERVVQLGKSDYAE